MRLWSLHPKYLDRQGLVALWREGLLAQKVLAGRTKGYRHHPQLIRFRETRHPLVSIGVYLTAVAEEAGRRGYMFNGSKILKFSSRVRLIPVSRGQLRFERQHLFKKLEARDKTRLEKLSGLKRLLTHPSFRSVAGKIHGWEKG